MNSMIIDKPLDTKQWLFIFQLSRKNIKSILQKLDFIFTHLDYFENI